MAMLQVTLSFSILLFSLGLDQSYVREFHEAENKPALLKRTMLLGLLLLLLLLLITVGVLLSFGGSMACFEELGVCSVAISFAVAAVILQSIFSTVWAPTVSKWAGNSVALAEKIDIQRPRVSGCCGYLCGMG
jgi:O-antigen/teichoic acid export membrane protein